VQLTPANGRTNQAAAVIFATPPPANRNTTPGDHGVPTSRRTPWRNATRTQPHTASGETRHSFTTDALRSGLPPHIAAKICGHALLDTTMGYAAIYPEDVITHHRAFIARRRAERPSEEYRELNAVIRGHEMAACDGG